ncbi:hypothetical protein B0E41_03855 [Hydrogenophaga sp. A37]|nr:hypothetical protein B0E41_03855 [Hydrogenophaga sp. A37]
MPSVAARLGAGDVLDLAFDATAKPYADAGKVEIIAVTGDHRDPRLPNVPTAAQSGLKDFVLGLWLGLFAPVGTPEAVVERLNKAVNAALAAPAWSSRWKTWASRQPAGQLRPWRTPSSRTWRFIGESSRMPS